MVGSGPDTLKPSMADPRMFVLNPQMFWGFLFGVSMYASKVQPAKNVIKANRPTLRNQWASYSQAKQDFLQNKSANYTADEIERRLIDLSREFGV